MSRTWMVGIVIGAAVLAATALGTAQSKGTKDAASDLSGAWTLDASKSDLPGGPGGFRGRMGGGDGGGGWGGRRGRGMGGGGWGGRSRGGSGDETSGGQGRPGGRGRRLPSYFRVTQRDGVVSFSDSTGALFQEIHAGGASAPEGRSGSEDAVRELTGRWDNGTLIAEWKGPGGGSLEQRYKLDDHGRELEVHVERKGGPDGGSGEGARRFGRREFKLVYRRAT
jgi:hypothetical protein